MNNKNSKNNVKTKRFLNKKLKRYSCKELENFKGGKVSVVKTTKEIEDFVNQELSKKTSNNKILFGKISDDIDSSISKKFGINIKDYSISLKGDNIRKIIKNHSNP